MSKAILAIYCCSFRRDLKRVVRLMDSIKRFNVDSLPVYISCPQKDLHLFQEIFYGSNLNILSEDSIISKIPGVKIDDFQDLKNGKIQQQIIKSEFWRLGLCKNYLVIDSDSQFIREFNLTDFIVEGSVPYSVIHEGRWFKRFTSRFGPKRARGEWQKDRLPIQTLLMRPGIQYDYGYSPFLWSTLVWETLYSEYLKPRGMNIIDAVRHNPSELTWYGEALLRFRPIPIWPREEFFRHYHYEHEFWFDKKLGFDLDLIRKDYLGVVYQSNWEHSLDFGGQEKNWPSRVWRHVKRSLKKSSFKTGMI